VFYSRSGVISQYIVQKKVGIDFILIYYRMGYVEDHMNI
jgi:hypothetical protein